MEILTERIILFIKLTENLNFFIKIFITTTIIINIVFLWYSAVCLLRINDVEGDMVTLLQKNETFLEQIENIHSLEMYYGDENLQSLIGDSRQLINDFIDVQEKYFDVEIRDLEYEDEENEKGQEKE